MKKNIFKKVLVTGIIILFIGIGLQPAFANEISITKTSDIDKGCKSCQPVNKNLIYRLKSLMNRFEKTKYILSIFSKHNPEHKEKYQEFSDKITATTEENNNYLSDLSWDFPYICDIGIRFYWKFYYSLKYLDEYILSFYDEYPLLCLILIIFCVQIIFPIGLGILNVLNKLLIVFDCDIDNYFICEQLPKFNYKINPYFN